MPRYPEIGDDWLPITKRGWRLKCCSCHLIHEIDFRVRDGQLEVRMRRHERATRASRRSLQKKVVIVDD